MANQGWGYDDLHIIFRWNKRSEEGKPSAADVKRLLGYVVDAGGFDVTVADFLKDVAHEAQELYDQMLALPRTGETKQ